MTLLDIHQDGTAPARLLVERAMKRPEEVTLGREEGEALIEYLERDALTAEDPQVLGKVVPFYFWLLFALREAKLSLKRLKSLVFGEKPKKREPRCRAGLQAMARFRVKAPDFTLQRVLSWRTVVVLILSGHKVSLQTAVNKFFSAVGQI